MNHTVKVVVPIYSTALSEYEKISLRSICGVLGSHPLVVVKPESLSLEPLRGEFPMLREESFADDCFRSIASYNRLMMSDGFYSRFADTEYILICQLDAYIFRDELLDWCARGYDYVGAPWLVRPMYRFPLFRFTSWLKKVWCRVLDKSNSQVTNFRVGNGGLSLRRVAAHLEATTKLKPLIAEYLTHTGNHIFNEDVFFSVEVNNHGLGFRYPDWQEALGFSFDKYPALCFKLNGGRLPMGCHSWYKRRMKKFWLPIICGDAEARGD